MTRPRPHLAWFAVVTLAAAGLAACGTDDGSAATPSTTPGTPTTADTGGGGMQAGAPQFQSFNVSPSAQCQGGNATAHMSFSTLNVVEIEIKIGSGKFQTTAGYGPDESDVIATIPCTGTGVSSVQLRGCTESHDCVESAQQAVQITA